MVGVEEQAVVGVYCFWAAGAVLRIARPTDPHLFASIDSVVGMLPRDF